MGKYNKKWNKEEIQKREQMDHIEVNPQQTTTFDDPLQAPRQQVEIPAFSELREQQLVQGSLPANAETDTDTEVKGVNDGKEVQPSIPMIPSALRNYRMFRKVDRKHFLSDTDFNRVCQVAAGDQRRIFQRVLMGIYQRAFLKRDTEEVTRARTMLSLHERGTLFQNIEVLG